MENLFDLLFSSPWFWIALILVILILAFRPQLARLIDRTQKAKAEAGKEGAKIELEASPANIDEKLPAFPLPSAPPGPSVEVGRGAVISGSTLGDIGNVIVKNTPAQAVGDARPASEAGTSWNTGAIRALLEAAFGDDELTTLCFDRFRPVYDQFSTGMSKVEKIQRLLEYCERHDEFGKLLAQVRERNRKQYERFEGRLRG